MLVRLDQIRFAGACGPEECEIFVDEPGQLVASRLVRGLDAEPLLNLLQELSKLELPELTCVRFDLSRVEHLVGPWGMHFAILIWASRQMSAPVSLSGLRGQPAALARLFRASWAVRALLVDERRRTETEGRSPHNARAA